MRETHRSTVLESGAYPQTGQRPRTVLVVGGVYDTGGRAIVGTMTNRVTIDKAIRVESLMGPEVTVIRGYQVPRTTNGDGAIRCVSLTNGAVLSGFTLPTERRVRPGTMTWSRAAAGCGVLRPTPCSRTAT